MVLLQLELPNDLQIFEALKCIDQGTVTASKFTDDLVLHPNTEMLNNFRPNSLIVSFNSIPELFPGLTFDLLGQSPSGSTAIYVYLAALSDYSLFYSFCGSLHIFHQRFILNYTLKFLRDIFINRKQLFQAFLVRHGQSLR